LFDKSGKQIPENTLLRKELLLKPTQQGSLFLTSDFTKLRISLSSKLGKSIFFDGKLAPSEKKLLVVKPQDLPIVKKQADTTWRLKKRDFYGKYVHQKKGWAQFVNASGETIATKINDLQSDDIELIESFESKAHPIFYEAGSEIMDPRHLLGRDVTIVFRSSKKKNIDELRTTRVVNQKKYGPIYRGRVDSVSGKSLYISGEAQTLDEDGSVSKTHKLSRKQIRLSYVKSGRKKYKGVECVLIEGYSYVPNMKSTKDTLLKRQDTYFSSVDRSFRQQQALLVKEARRVAAKKRAAASSMAIANGLFKGLQLYGTLKELERNPHPNSVLGILKNGKPNAKNWKQNWKQNCVIKGKVPPNTKVMVGSGIGTYWTTHSDSLGNYRILPVLRPSKGTHHLSIEIGGKRKEFWRGQLNTEGVNVLNY
jgi:hypothetical protein